MRIIKRFEYTAGIIRYYIALLEECGKRYIAEMRLYPTGRKIVRDIVPRDTLFFNDEVTAIYHELYLRKFR